MFNWFAPSCPCDPAAKKWVEERLQWLSRQFGLHILLERPIILPTDEFFPDPWDGSPKAAKALFRRVCGYMGVDPTAVRLQLFDDRTPDWLAQEFGFAAGTWSASGSDSDSEETGYGSATPAWDSRGSGAVIRLERGALDQPSNLIGTLAHELAHQRLLGEGRIMRSVFDNELLTDLTAVYFGFGIFLANNPRKSTGELRHWPGTNLHRPEYISEPMLGYALAHMAWFRDEERPAWAKHLKWSLGGTFKQGLRYLRHTSDSQFKPVRLRDAE